MVIDLSQAVSAWPVGDANAKMPVRSRVGKVDKLFWNFRARSEKVEQLFR